MLSFLKKHPMSQGSVLLSTIVVFIIFFLIMGASVNYINDQFHYGAGEEERAQAFRSAEAGVDHVLFLLNSEAETHVSLLGLTEGIEENILNPFSQEVIGSYELTFAELTETEGVEGLLVTSVGRSSGDAAACYTIEATIERLTDVGFTVVKWHDDRGC